jgi:galactose mutarotase-like enzyme
MSNHILENSFLQVDISSKGAELQSIFHKAHQLEYMWGGDAKFWGKKSPVLFPIVGGLKNNTYLYKGNSYSLSRHGFAREMEFVVTDQTENSITFSIYSNEQTLKVYPFNFQFSLRYELNDHQLSVQYIVENIDDDEMYFSVGAHPAFKVPLVDTLSFNDFYLKFNTIENEGRWPLSADGLIEKKSISLLNNTNQLPLTKELFYGDALVFKQLQSNSISIMSDQVSHGLKVQFDDFPFMGIWSAKDANFVCIEPWCGIADSVETNQDITKKEGIHFLQTKDIFKRSWTVEVF